MNRQLPTPSFYLISDRRAIPHNPTKLATDALVEFVGQAAAAGVDLIQIREPDLSARSLVNLTERIVEAVRPTGARVLVNDRADIAVACGAGVHLKASSMRADVVRKTFGEDLLIGVSTHSLQEAREAETGGADFIVFGPVFATASKQAYGKPVGLQAVRSVAAQVQIPVLALGGIQAENYQSALDAGASGIAAISFFLQADVAQQAMEKAKAKV